MKKSLVALAALAATGAFAQSSVTLFGILDATIAVGNGDTSNKTQLTNSGLNSSRLGFRGVEDLGGGLKASFVIEGAVNNDNGTGGTSNLNNQATGAGPAAAGSQGFTFNRQSIVSLLGSFGEIRLGRDYTPQFWSFSVYDPFGTNGVGTTQALNSSLTSANGGGFTTIRATNTIAYLSPTVGGFGVWVQTYFGENASNAASQAGDGTGIRVAYDNGPLSLAAAFSKTTTGVGTNVTTTNFGASYDLPFAKLMAFYNTDSNTGLADLKSYDVGALVPAGPGTIRFAFSSADNGTAKTDKWAIGYVYNFSKRTALYGTFASLSNSGGAAQSLNGAVTPANGASTGIDLGIRHVF